MQLKQNIKLFRIANFVKCLIALQCLTIGQLTANATVIFDEPHQYPDYYEEDWDIRNNVDSPLDSVDEYNYLTSKLSDQIKVGVKFKNLSKSGIVFEAKLKKCDDEKYPIYKIKRSSACGIYGYRNIRSASCGIETYKSCYLTPDSYRQFYPEAINYNVTKNAAKYDHGWHDGYSSLEGCESLGNSRPWSKKNGYRLQDPNSYYESNYTYWEGDDQRLFGQRVKAEHRCVYDLDLFSATYRPVRDQACGAEKYNVCSRETVYNQCRDSSHGIERYRQRQSLLCPFTVNKVITEKEKIYDYVKNRDVVNVEIECTQYNPQVNPSENNSPLKKLSCLVLSNKKWFGKDYPHPVLYNQIADILTSQVVLKNFYLQELDQLDFADIDMEKLKIEINKMINQKFSTADSYKEFIIDFGEQIMNSNLNTDQLEKSVKLTELLLSAEKVSQYYQDEAFMTGFRQYFVKNSYLQNSIQNSRSINAILFYYSQLVGNVIANNNYAIYLLYYAKNQLKQYQNLNPQLKQQISQIVKDPTLANKLYLIQTDNIQDAFNLLNTTINSISQKNDRLISMTESDVAQLTSKQRPFELIPLYFALGRYQDIVFSVQDHRSVLNSDYFQQTKDWLRRVANAKMTHADSNLLVLSQLSQPSMSLINQLELKTRNSFLIQLNGQQSVLNTVVASLKNQMQSDLESLNRIKELFQENSNSSEETQPPPPPPVW